MKAACRIFLLVLAGAALAPGQQLTGGAFFLDNGTQGPVSLDCAVDGAVVNAVTGEPVPRARVSVAAGSTGAQAATDNGGKWSLTAAPCGPVQIVVSRQGFLPYVYGQRQGRPLAPLSLFAGQPLHDVKIELSPQAVVIGRVLDDVGDPVVNVSVSVMAARVVDGRFSFQPAASANSNDIGEFRVPNLAKGRYIVCARRNVSGSQPGIGSPPALADSCYPGPLEGGVSSTMEIPAGRDTRVDFNLLPAATVHVRGTVSGQPSGRGFGISLMRDADGPGYGRNYPAAVRPDGKFDIAGVPPGAYTLIGNFLDGPKRLFAHVPVNVGQADLDDLAVQMEEGFTLTATVRVDSSADPPPAVPQFGVNLRPAEPGSAGGPVKWSDDHRTIQFLDLAPGDYQLVLNPVAPLYVKGATIAGQDILRSEAMLNAGSGQIEIVLRDDGGAIEGDVSDDMGNPAGAGIMAIPRAGRPVNAFAFASGYFKLQNLAPGDYTLYAWDNPQEVAWADADWMRTYGAKGVAVTVSPGQTAPIKLTRIAVPAP
jgi:hypothetical protein